MDDYKALPFNQLRSLHREIAALIAQRRHDELEEIKQRVAMLGFSAAELAPQKQKKGSGAHATKYRNPDTGETYSGRGKHPAWLKDRLEAGHTLDEFLIQSG